MNSDIIDFQKGLILCGDPCTGKSLIVNFFGAVMPGQIFNLGGRNKKLFKDPFVFSTLTEDHKLILVDDVKCISTIEATYPLIQTGQVIVRRQMREDIERKCPPIIITTTVNYSELLQVPGLFRRFHIVEISICSYT